MHVKRRALAIKIRPRLGVCTTIQLCASDLRISDRKSIPPEQQTPEALAAFQKAELEKWGPVVAAAKIKVE
jgi:hypothetical protein